MVPLSLWWYKQTGKENKVEAVYMDYILETGGKSMTGGEMDQ